ncbi:MAG: Era-like GTP-binding protein [Isosphaeraceae bacterium]
MPMDHEAKANAEAGTGSDSGKAATDHKSSTVRKKPRRFGFKEVLPQEPIPPGNGEKKPAAETEGGGDAVDQARDSLEATLAGLKLTAEEEKMLSSELGQLRELSKKLDENTIEIAAFGMVSRGKSSVLNALLGRDVFEVGATHGTTVTRSAQRWEEGSRGSSGLDQARLILVDTPGIDEVGGEVRETMAREVARTADLILFIISSDMQRREVEALSELRSHQKPILLVFNQIDRYPEADRQQIHAKLEDERVRGLIRPEDIVLTAARPDPIRIKIQQPDGSSKLVWERPAPLIEPLKTRILDVLEREGKALVALNTLLLAGDLHE